MKLAGKFCGALEELPAEIQVTVSIPAAGQMFKKHKRLNFTRTCWAIPTIVRTMV